MDDTITHILAEVARKVVLVKSNKRLRAKDRDILTEILNYDIPVAQEKIKQLKSLL